MDLEVALGLVPYNTALQESMAIDDKLTEAFQALAADYIRRVRQPNLSLVNNYMQQNTARYANMRQQVDAIAAVVAGLGKRIVKPEDVKRRISVALKKLKKLKKKRTQ